MNVLDHLPPQLLIPLGVITAAIIAGLFSYLSLIIAKESKVSEFRQAWIDELRKEIARFIASIKTVRHVIQTYRAKHGKIMEPEAFSSAVKDHHSQAVICFNSILLRLNPVGESNKKNAELIDALTAVERALAGAENDYDKANALLPEVRLKGQELLRSEWLRVKKGEATFYWSKRVILVLLAILLAIGGVLIRDSLKREPTVVGEPASVVPASSAQASQAVGQPSAQATATSQQSPNKTTSKP